LLFAKQASPQMSYTQATSNSISALTASQPLP
jgi:hypothetical protein